MLLLAQTIIIHLPQLHNDTEKLIHNQHYVPTLRT